MQRESLGPAIELKPGYETFWAYIPHFIHSPFYVYAYAFGDCLVNSLYAVYEHAAEGFAERYLAMLTAGGTKHHSELLKPFGLDARDPAFWQGGLSVIERMIGSWRRLWRSVMTVDDIAREASWSSRAVLRPASAATHAQGESRR